MTRDEFEDCEFFHGMCVNYNDYMCEVKTVDF